jgi:Leucine-rich repeat (LRR) protein
METLAKIKTLSQVFLEKNNVEKVESLDALKELKELERLELGDNPITEEADYRQRVLDGYSIKLV